MAVNLINLTTETVKVDDITIPPVGIVAELECVTEEIKNPETDNWLFIGGASGFWGFPLQVTRPVATRNLPELQVNTILIVSDVVRQANPDRPDLASPGEKRYDHKGRFVCYTSLIVNECAKRLESLIIEDVKADFFMINGLPTFKKTVC